MKLTEVTLPTAPQRRKLGTRRVLTGVLALAGAICQLGGCSPKKAPDSAIPSPSPSVAPTVAATPTPTPTDTSETRTYSGAQQAEYIRTAQNGFIEARGVKSTAFGEANQAFNEAGGASVKGLTSKESIAERRTLIEKCRVTNEDYIAFVKTQDNAYRDELAKTPLAKSDVDSLVADFSARAKADSIIKLRETRRDLIKTADEMMAFLADKYGAWTVSGTRPAFKKPVDTNVYAALGKKYNGYAEIVQKMSEEVNAPLPTPGESPIPSLPPGTGGATSPAPTTK